MPWQQPRVCRVSVRTLDTERKSVEKKKFTRESLQNGLRSLRRYRGFCTTADALRLRHRNRVVFARRLIITGWGEKNEQPVWVAVLLLRGGHIIALSRGMGGGKAFLGGNAGQGRASLPRGHQLLLRVQG